MLSQKVTDAMLRGSSEWKCLELSDMWKKMAKRIVSYGDLMRKRHQGRQYIHKSGFM